MASNAASTAGSCRVGSGTAITPAGVARSRTSVIATASRRGWSSHSGNALGMANGAASAAARGLAGDGAWTTGVVATAGATGTTGDVGIRGASVFARSSMAVPSVREPAAATMASN